MRALTAILLATLVACSGASPTEPTANGTDTPAKKGGGKKKAAAPAPAAGEEAAADEPGSGPPVLRTGRFRIPLKDLQDPEALRKALIVAWEKSAKAEGVAAPPPEEKAKPWKCRKVTAWETSGATGAQLRLFERLDTTDCKGAEAKEEEWELMYRVETPVRPTAKDQGGTLKYLMASEDYDWTDGSWKKAYGSVYRIEGPKDGGDFANDDAWVGNQLPGGVKTTKKAEVLGWRWSLGTFIVADEKVTVEAERWDCQDGRVAGAEIVFRTNKRAPGHAQNAPKDVLVTEKFQAFADAVGKELAAQTGGQGTVVAAGMTCAAK